MNVSACLVTRGDCDMDAIVASLARVADDVVIWDNSQREDLGIYGRYAAIAEAKHDLILTQDDDVIVPWELFLEQTVPSDDTVFANYPQPWDIPWVARGALFHRDAPSRAFEMYLSRFPFDRFFTHLACDGIFTLLSNTKVIDVGSEDLPHGFDEGRVSTSPGWYDAARPEIQRRVEAIRRGA